MHTRLVIKWPYFLHCLICSGLVYSLRHSVMWSPILIRHCRVCSSCSRSDSPFSGRSNCFSAAFTGLMRSLHWKIHRHTCFITVQSSKTWSCTFTYDEWKGNIRYIYYTIINNSLFHKSYITPFLCHCSCIEGSSFGFQSDHVFTCFI